MDEAPPTGIRRALAWGALFSLVAAAACNGTLGFPHDETIGGGGGIGDGGPSDPGANNGAHVPGLSSSTRFRRLTHQEWSNTIHDLFGVDAAPLTASFRTDPRASGFLFDNNALALEVDQALASGYQRVAAQLAEQLVSAQLAELVPGGSSDDERARAFIQNVGQRMHRRPLTQDQVDGYFALYQQGRSSFDDMPGLAGGVRLVLEALLQSPFFLYRVELSHEAQNGRVALDGWERAQRLSYFFWNTMPDEELFAAAASGGLDSPDGVAAQARRLIEDERAREVIERFYWQLFEVDRYTRIAPSQAHYPFVSEGLAGYAAEETRRFVGHVIYDEGGTIADLLTSTTTFVNAELAEVYGLTGNFSTDFTQVELDPAERRGILTQVGFLAANATSVVPDPIHRGVFVAKRLNCLSVPAPPDVVPPLPEPGDKTNRELVDEHTGGPGCGTCHNSVINPFGFPFESYDAVGAFRTEDNGKPVDTTATPPVGSTPTEIADATELAEVMASSVDVHACIAKHLFEYAYGQPSTDADTNVTADLGAQSLGGTAFKELMVSVAVAEPFLNRPQEEAQ